MSFLSRLNIIPQFPTYPGPYDVGSFELEIPASSLEPASKASPPDANVETVQFRVFYPAEKSDSANTTGWFGNTAKKPIRWLPEPYQREYLSGYARFLGVSSGFAEIVSYLPRALYYISLPATANAPLLGEKSQEFRFPTMVFSHGLGGTRLAYSHICGSIASYGVIVVVPEHRDGSGPVSFVKVPTKKTAHVSGGKPEAGEPGINESSAKAEAKEANGRVQVDYRTYPHQVSEETENGRNKQLELRLWELNLIYSALSKIDVGKVPEDTIMSGDEEEEIKEGTIGPEAKKLLSTFKGKLDVKEPGKLIWAGHSFGAATMIQFLKSIYYPPPKNSSIKPLFTPDTSLPSNSLDALSLDKQITATSPLLLLDPWCLPLLGKRTSHLFKQPLPQISNNPSRVLVNMSEEFFRWKENLRGVKRILSPNPGQKRGTPHHEIFEKWDEAEAEDIGGTAAQNEMSKYFHPDNDLLSPTLPSAVESASAPDQGGQIIPPTATPSPTPEKQHGRHHVAKNGEPRFYYVKKSAHLSQSDFGILFPVVVRRAENPQRILDLNVRATIQWLREAGYSDRLAKTENFEELVHGLRLNGDDDKDQDKEEAKNKNKEGDWRIWEEGDAGVEGWERIDLEETDIPDDVKT